MDVHIDHTVGPKAFQEVGNHPGTDRFAAFSHAVLACIRKVGDQHTDRVHAGPSEGVNVQKQLHQMVINWFGAGLNDENILFPHDLIDGDMGFTIWKDGRG